MTRFTVVVLSLAASAICGTDAFVGGPTATSFARPTQYKCQQHIPQVSPGPGSVTALEASFDKSSNNHNHAAITAAAKILPAAALVLAGMLSLNVATANAEVIKTFDMSMPSYDKISDAKASVAGAELKDEKIVEAKRDKEIKEKKQASSGAGSGGLSFSMPSFGGGDTGGGSSSSSSSADGEELFKINTAEKDRLKLEKIAAKQAKVAAQKLENEERERIMKEKIEVVNFDMPSYDSSSSSGKKSVFSL
jgi:hypothetical protein